MVSPSRGRPGYAAVAYGVALLQSSLPPVEGIFDPPAPKCPSFTCPAGQKPVGRPEHTISSHGCRDSGVNFANMGDLNGMPGGNPFANLGGGPKLNKCCVEKDLCRQTCGMSAKACHDKFQACTGRICGNDQNCKLQAMMSDFKYDAGDDEDSKKDPDAKYDPDVAKCKPYHKGQKEACMCVPEAQFKPAVERKLKAFYSKFNHKKLDRSGNIIDVDEVWKKWTGKEADMFMALASKYKDKAVRMKSNPQPPPYPSQPPPSSSASSSRPTRREDPPAGDDDEDDAPEVDVGGDAPADTQAPPAAETSSAGDVDSEETAFDQKYEAAVAKKRKAVDDEDYDEADRVKTEIAEMAQSELKRLQGLKAKAVSDEDFIEAKRIKTRMSKLEL